MQTINLYSFVSVETSLATLLGFGPVQHQFKTGPAGPLIARCFPSTAIEVNGNALFFCFPFRPPFFSPCTISRYQYRLNMIKVYSVVCVCVLVNLIHIVIDSRNAVAFINIHNNNRHNIWRNRIATASTPWYVVSSNHYHLFIYYYYHYHCNCNGIIE